MTKNFTTTAYITQKQAKLLKALSKKTRVPMAVYIRDAIDLVLKKHDTHQKQTYNYDK